MANDRDVIIRLLERLDDLDRRRKFEHFPTTASKAAAEAFKDILAGHWDIIRAALTKATM